jgi:predicted ArsR family transcriptional regulator
MRAPGEIRQALVQAVHAQPRTLRELAHAACVGERAARGTLANLRRAGAVVVREYRRVDYVNRPVAVYAPARRASAQATMWGDLTAAWGAAR